MTGLALVTGASTGIGFSIARQLADRGYHIVGVGASERIRDLPAKLTQTVVYPVQADLTLASDVERVWREVQNLGESLEVAVLNAGVSIGGAFVETDLDAELKMIALNVTSQVILAKHIVPLMIAQKRGRILITSSLSATTPTPYETIYGPTRSFMFSFAESLREELRHHGVSVTALLPGATATEFHDRAGMGNTFFGDNSWKNDPDLVARRGLDALFKGKDHVIGGDLKSRWAAIRNKFLPERWKAARHAELARPK